MNKEKVAKTIKEYLANHVLQPFEDITIHKNQLVLERNNQFFLVTVNEVTPEKRYNNG